MSHSTSFGAFRWVKNALAPAFACALFVVISLSACSSPSTLDERNCPPGGTDLTYESFAKPFLNANCQTCHGQHGSAREGAPVDCRFDSREDIARWKERIYRRAADDNDTMPIGPDDVSRSDRLKLGDWLACGAP